MPLLEGQLPGIGAYLFGGTPRGPPPYTQGTAPVSGRSPAPCVPLFHSEGSNCCASLRRGTSFSHGPWQGICSSGQEEKAFPPRSDPHQGPSSEHRRRTPSGWTHFVCHPVPYAFLLEATEASCASGRAAAPSSLLKFLKELSSSRREVSVQSMAGMLLSIPANIHLPAVALLSGVPAWHTPDSPSLNDDRGGRPGRYLPLAGLWGLKSLGR